MTDETAPGFAEYIKPVAKNGANRVLGILLTAGTILFAVGYILLFTAAVMLPQLIALLPLFVWMLVFFTKPLVRYECGVTVGEGKIVFSRVWDKKRKVLKEISLRDATALWKAPFQPKASLPVFDFRADKTAEMFYAVLFTENGKEAYALFEAEAHILSALCYRKKEIFTFKL